LSAAQQSFSISKPISPNPKSKEPSMPELDFQHIRVSMVKDVAVVEIRTRELNGYKPAQELGSELALVTGQDWARRLLVNFHRVGFLGSTVFSVLFKLVSRAKAEGREVKLCAMEPGVRLGAEIVGLDKLVDIHENEGSALNAFPQA
jgi:anti-sigma B factor antagonist